MKEGYTCKTAVNQTRKIKTKPSLFPFKNTAGSEVGSSVPGVRHCWLASGLACFWQRTERRIGGGRGEERRGLRQLKKQDPGDGLSRANQHNSWDNMSLSVHRRDTSNVHICGRKIAHPDLRKTRQWCPQSSIWGVIGKEANRTSFYLSFLDFFFWRRATRCKEWNFNERSLQMLETSKQERF